MSRPTLGELNARLERRLGQANNNTMTTPTQVLPCLVPLDAGVGCGDWWLFQNEDVSGRAADGVRFNDDNDKDPHGACAGQYSAMAGWTCVNG